MAQVTAHMDNTDSAMGAVLPVRAFPRIPDLRQAATSLKQTDIASSSQASGNSSLRPLPILQKVALARCMNAHYIRIVHSTTTTAANGSEDSSFFRDVGHTTLAQTRNAYLAYRRWAPLVWTSYLLLMTLLGACVGYVYLVLSKTTHLAVAVLLAGMLFAAFTVGVTSYQMFASVPSAQRSFYEDEIRRLRRMVARSITTTKMWQQHVISHGSASPEILWFNPLFGLPGVALSDLLKSNTSQGNLNELRPHDFVLAPLLLAEIATQQQQRRHVITPSQP